MRRAITIAAALSLFAPVVALAEDQHRGEDWRIGMDVTSAHLVGGVAPVVRFNLLGDLQGDIVQSASATARLTHQPLRFSMSRSLALANTETGTDTGTDTNPNTNPNTNTPTNMHIGLSGSMISMDVRSRARITATDLLVDGGPGLLSTASTAQARATLSAQSLMMVFTTQAPATQSPQAFRPWMSFGIGLVRTSTSNFTVTLEENLSLNAPNFSGQDSFSGSVSIPDSSTVSLAYELSAGFTQELGNGWEMGVLARYSALGRFRLNDPGSGGGARVSLNDVTLLTTIDGGPDRLSTVEFGLFVNQRF